MGKPLVPSERVFRFNGERQSATFAAGALAFRDLLADIHREPATGEPLSETEVAERFAPRIVNDLAGDEDFRLGYAAALANWIATGRYSRPLDVEQWIPLEARPQHREINDADFYDPPEHSLLFDVCGLAVAGFQNMKALSTRNDAPQQASRPFDKDRDGFVLGDGGAIVVLESLEHAQRRGANILGEVLGYGLSGDANHITSPAPEGEGAQRAMRDALQSGGLKASDVGYINAHGTSTPQGDIVLAAGDHRTAIRMRTADYLKLAEARAGHFAIHDSQEFPVHAHPRGPAPRTSP